MFHDWFGCFVFFFEVVGFLGIVFEVVVVVLSCDWIVCFYLGVFVFVWLVV